MYSPITARKNQGIYSLTWLYLQFHNNRRKADTSQCVTFASSLLLRFAVKGEASTVQTVSAVAGPAVPLHWGLRGRHFTRWEFKAVRQCVYMHSVNCIFWGKSAKQETWFVKTDLCWRNMICWHTLSWFLSSTTHLVFTEALVRDKTQI